MGSERAIPESTPHLTGYEPSGRINRNRLEANDQPCDRLLSLLPTGRSAFQKGCPGEKCQARALALPQPGMAGQGDTGAAEQASRPPLSADYYAAAAEAAAAAAMRLISAHTRVLGEAYVHLWYPAPNSLVGSDAVADAGPAVGATTASRAERFFPTYIYACRNTTPAEGGHRQGDGGGTERVVGHP